MERQPSIVRRTGAIVARRPLGVALLACLALAPLGLLLPCAPSEDPWAWLVWGREIVHGQLNLAGGGSWKPLPMAFTIPYALLGGAAPHAWLVTVWAAGLMSCVLAARIAWRLAGPVAGVAAGAGQLLIASWLRYATSGISELIVVALLLGAIEAHLAGRRRAALVLIGAAALGRPEALAILAVYAAPLLWRRRHLITIAAVAVAVPLAWYLPQRLAGDPSQASQLAQSGLGNRTGTIVPRALTMFPAPVGALAVAALLFAIVRRERRDLALAALAVGWGSVVVVMNLEGYAGLRRFFLPAAAVLTILAGVGLARLAERLGRGPLTRALAACAILAAAAPFALPNPSFRYQYATAAQREAMVRSLAGAVRLTGTPAAIQACGDHPAVNSSTRTALAWYLGLPMDVPAKSARRSVVVFSARANLASPSGPPHARPGVPAIVLLRRAGWTVYVSAPRSYGPGPGCSSLVARHAAVPLIGRVRRIGSPPRSPRATASDGGRTLRSRSPRAPRRTTASTSSRTRSGPT